MAVTHNVITTTAANPMGITIANAGDLVVAEVWLFPNTSTITAVSSARVPTWTAGPTINDASSGLVVYTFYGTSASAGTDTVTFTAAGAAIQFSSFQCSELHDTSGGTVWTVTPINTASGATTSLAFPSLTGAGAYLGYLTVGSGTITAGSTAGFAYTLIGTEVLIAFNPSVSGTNAPTATNSAAAGWDAAGLIANVASALATGTESLGFSRTTSGALATNTAGGGTMQLGFMRDSAGRLCISTNAGTWQTGFLRDSAGYLVTVPYASASGAKSYAFDGFLRDANSALITVTSATASGTPSMQLGFMRDANLALLIA